MYAALEIPVTREHGATHQFALFHRFLDFRSQRPGIADASRATIADQVKTHFLELIQQVRFLEIVADHPRPGRQAALDPRFGLKSFCRGVAGEQAGRHHHGRVRSVGATGDGGDQHRPVAKLEVLTIHADLGPAVAFSAADFLRQVILENHGSRFQRDTILRPFRPGNAGFDTRYVQFKNVAVIGIGLSILTPQALGPGIGFDQLDGVRIAPAKFEVAERFAVDREYCAGTAELRRHIGQRRAIGERQVRQPIAKELDKFSNHAFLAKHLGNGEYQVGCGGALGQVTPQFEADDLWNQHRNRLTQHRRFGLDATDSPTQHAQPVHHGRVGVGSDQRVRVRLQHAILFDPEDDSCQVFQVDLVNDPGVWRDHLEIVKGILSPAQE